VERLDLPGHQVGSQKFLKQFVTWLEIYLFKALKKISAGKSDLASHFVLVAQRV
jgi:hypothetical protein